MLVLRTNLGIHIASVKVVPADACIVHYMRIFLDDLGRALTSTSKHLGTDILLSPLDLFLMIYTLMHSAQEHTDWKLARRNTKNKFKK